MGPISKGREERGETAGEERGPNYKKREDRGVKRAYL